MTNATTATDAEPTVVLTRAVLQSLMTPRGG